MARVAQAVIEAKVVGTDQVQRSLKNVDNSMRRTQHQSKAVNNQLRLMRGGFGQVGHQIQDVAVQLQMGQNALLVFGQQGGQIASLFGPKGAVIGAILAVGAAISMVLMKNVFAASDALKDLEEKGKSLADEFDELDAVMKAIAIKQVNEEIKALDDVIANANKEMEALGKSFDRQNKRNELSEERVATFNKKMEEQQDIINLAITERDKLTQKIDDNTNAFAKLDEKLQKEIETLGLASEAIQILEIQQSKMTDAEKESAIQKVIDIALRRQQIEALDEEAKAREKNTQLIEREKKQQQDAFEKLIESLDQEVATFGMSTLAIKRHKIETGNLTEAQKKDALMRLERLESIDREKNKIEALTKAQEDALKDLEQQAEDFKQTYRPLFQEFGDGFTDAITGAQNFADAMKGVAKSVIDSLIRMAIQKMIIDKLFGGFMSMFGPQQSTTNFATDPNNILNYKPPPIPSGLNLEGGGFTGYGSRSGGLDGRGGFMAMLHPNETVIDHTKGSGGGVVIQQTINVTTGVQQTVRAEIATLMPQIAQATKAAVADARMRGGNFSKSMVGA